MTLKQLEDLVTIDEDITDDQYGTYYDKRTVEQLLNYGLILLDKPAGPTSHEVVAWTKRILEISKAGHSGTLDPQVTGVLPLGLVKAQRLWVFYYLVQRSIMHWVDCIHCHLKKNLETF